MIIVNSDVLFIVILAPHFVIFQGHIYLLKVNNDSTRTICEIPSQLPR